VNTEPSHTHVPTSAGPGSSHASVPPPADPWRLLAVWSRLRVALIGAVIGVLASTAMRTTSAPQSFDRSALLIFEDAVPAALVGAVLAIALILQGERIRGWLEKIPRWIVDLALFAVGMWMAARMTFQAFGAVPQIQDEISYDLIARRMSIGHPVPSSPPAPEFFRMRFLVDDGRNYPLFQPGWPLLIAAFYKLGKPGLAPAFAVASLIVGASRLAERLYGRLTSLLAGTLLVACGFLMVVGGAFFAHAWAAALFVLALERLIAAMTEEDPKKARNAAVVGGLFGAWLVFTRLPTALGFAITAAVAVVGYAFEGYLPRPRLLERARRPLLAFGLAFMLGPLAQAGWNTATTGHATMLPQDRYFDQTEPIKNCHRLGFGKGIGCPREHPPEVRPEGYTLERAFVVNGIRWSVFRTDTWGTAWPIALAGLVLVRRRLRAREAVLIAGSTAPVVLYLGFYYHANQHGARLWTDVLGPLAVAVAAGALGPFERDADRCGAAGADPPERKSHLAHRLLGAVSLMLLVLVVHDELTRDIPERIVNIGKNRQAERVSKALDAANVHDAVVYVANCIEPDRADIVYGWASVLNAPDPDKGDRIFVRDFGPEHDRQLASLYPNRKHVRVDCNGGFLSSEPDVPRPELVVTELEAKFPPDERAGCYAAIKGNLYASNRMVLEVRATEAKAWARFRQYVYADGAYDLRVVAYRRPDGGKFTFAVDGKELGVIDSAGGPEFFTATLGNVPLTRGVHTLEFRSLEGPGARYFVLDRLELARK
jgi:hypothetical protein